MRTHLALLALVIPACGVTSDDVLTASDDELIVEMNAANELDVTQNDAGVVEGSELSIVTEPAHGTASFDEAGVLHYEPSAEFMGDDELRYAITNPDGTVSEARVAIAVQCASCALGATVQLHWDPSPANEGVLGFRMYFAPTEDAAAMVMFDDVTVDQPGFDPAMPTMIYDAWEDLRLRKGETVCFRLTAYNEFGESDFSNAACKTVDGLSMRFGL